MLKPEVEVLFTKFPNCFPRIGKKVSHSCYRGGMADYPMGKRTGRVKKRKTDGSYTPI
jgi:hypothetical protein